MIRRELTSFLNLCQKIHAQGHQVLCSHIIHFSISAPSLSYLLPLTSPQTSLNRLPNLLRPRARNPLLNIPILENTKSRHLTNSQLLRNVLTLFNIIRVKLDIWVLGYHFGDFRSNHFAVLAPCCCAFEDRDAFVHDGFEVLGFGVEGWDVGGGHCNKCFDGRYVRFLEVCLENGAKILCLDLKSRWKVELGMGEGNYVIPCASA